MQIKEIMTREPDVVNPLDSVRDVARKMKELDVGVMPVCDGKRVTGMITDRDITVRVTAEGRDPQSTKAQEAMTPDPAYMFDDQDETEAADTMERLKVRRLIVVDRDKSLTGILSLGDLAVKGANERKTTEVTEQVSEPAKPKR